MINLRHIIRVAMLSCIANLFCFKLSAKENLVLWYNHPANYWEEALPLGNGRLGAMVYGTVEQDTIQLNEDSFWSGSPYNNYNENCLPHLKEIRSLISEGTHDALIKAQKMTMDYIIADKSKTGHGMAYESVGQLLISTDHKNITNYRRSLDIENAVATVSYDCDGVTYVRTYFTSLIDKLIFIHLAAYKKGKVIDPKKLNIPILSFIAPGNGSRVKVTLDKNNPDQWVVKSSLVAPAMENIPNKLDCTTLINSQIDKDGITYIISCASSFNGYKNLPADSRKNAEYYINAFNEKSKKFIPTSHYNSIYERAQYEHSWKYKKQFNRVSLNLGCDSLQSLKDTETRIREFSTYTNGNKPTDPSLVSLYFQFGRYLLISSSQPNSQPANLQGIWNPDSRFYPAWDSKYTTNINAEMNYWPSEVTNLSECSMPFFNMLKDVSESGSVTAKKMYGARGWVLHHNTDIWRATGAVDYSIAGVWPTGGAWFCSHLWEHFLYTGDLSFLKTYYPIMKGASQFFQDYLYLDPVTGYMVAGPSVSPENNPDIASYNRESDGKKQNCAVFSGITMDNQLIYNLFTITSQAARFLKTDKAYADSLDVLKTKLPPMQIGQYGQLQEWLQDWDKENSSHRHISHLWGAFPGNMISPYSYPELFSAVRKSLSGRGDASRGWSMGWKVCQWARQQDGNHALLLIKNQLKLKNPNADMRKDQNGGSYANMFDAHPPFQIDGNFGCCAGIAEMLVQSYDAAIHILPALPDEWKGYGCVKGLKCRGGFEIVELEWKNGHINHLIIKSTLGGNLRLRSMDKLYSVNRKKVIDYNNPYGHRTKFTLAEIPSAEGINTNPFMQQYLIPKPIIKDPSKIIMPNLLDTILFDIATEPGKDYEFVSPKSSF